MALTIFLYQVSNLDLGGPIPESVTSSQQDLIPPIVDETQALLCAKVRFRGTSLWSNNVSILNRTANFVGRRKKPKRFHYTIGTMLLPEDKLRIEFYTLSRKKRGPKMIAICELMLETLLEIKYIDIPEENLTDPNNHLLESTVRLKLYYTSPTIDKERAALGIDADEAGLVDWLSTFDEMDRHGGHRRRHIRSKYDSNFKKFTDKVIGRVDDANTDSNSDSDFDETKDGYGGSTQMTGEEKLLVQNSNIEILEKGLGRYEGDLYQIKEWQIMVHVMQARDLAGLDINPYVCIQIDDQKKKTGVHKCTNSPFFAEFFTFDFSYPATQMMEKVINFRVHHAKKIISTFKDTKPIGVFKVDVSTVYNEKEHLFERKWAKLTNNDFTEAKCGDLLLSIGISERGVVSKNILGELFEGEDEFDSSKRFIPAAMPRTLLPIQLKITFFAATELPEMMTDFLATVSRKILRSDQWEPIDSYVEIKYNGLMATTERYNGTSPVWSETLYLNGQFPSLVRTIRIAVKDHAAVQQDRIIASFLMDLFSISDVSAGDVSATFLPTFGPTWMFLYGSPREYSISKDQDGLGEGMGEGVCYKGRLLMEIECLAVSGDNVPSKVVQKQSGIHFPEAHVFPMKRTFLLFGCIYDVTMIDKSLSSATIRFELSIGSSGYLNANELASSISAPSITRAFPSVPIKNNTENFRLPIDLVKPIIFTRYNFHDYSYRMMVSNRLKRAAEHMTNSIREFESHINSKVSTESLMDEYVKMEEYVQKMPCGCAEGNNVPTDNKGVSSAIHPTLSEFLNFPLIHLRMNTLDEKRRKKIINNLELLDVWISKKKDFDEAKLYETVKELRSITRVLRQLAFDIQPSLPDVFLWMISNSKRVAYVRIPPEDLLFSLCYGERGLHNGRVQTLFLRTPRTSDKPTKSLPNTKVQIYLWLGLEEQEKHIFKTLPKGFEKPTSTLSDNINHIQYNKRSFYEIRCHIYTARSLIASDDTGLSDPYLKITAGNATQTTPIIKESLCPQWNLTLAFENLIHVGNRDTAEEIIGNVVVECCDYDDGDDGPDVLGRFSTTAKLDLYNQDKSYKKTAFQWHELKFGEKRAGELLAVFELIEITPETEALYDLQEIEKTPENFPPNIFITKVLNNKVYHIPNIILPDMKTYEIEVMFWGLRECRSIHLLDIKQAEVTIDCTGTRLTKTIKDVQKCPNFDSNNETTDIYTLTVNLPEDRNFWPHISISCVRTLMFGRKEIVGTLVVTDLYQYLEKTEVPITPDREALAEEINEISKRTPKNFNRILKSVVDAYDAVVATKDQDVAKEKLKLFEQEAGQKTSDDNDALINEEKEEDDIQLENDESMDIDVSSPKTTKASVVADHPTQTHVDKLLRCKIEKEASWWSRYYAAKAKLGIEKRAQAKSAELVNKNNLYIEDFDGGRSKALKSRTTLWSKVKKLFMSADKARKELRMLVIAEMENMGDKPQTKSAFDDSLDDIDGKRLKELELLQTFEIVEELENVYDYEGFRDCLDKFPLYKGKGTSRSDEIGDEKRVYAKFKGKFRIRDLSKQQERPDTIDDTENDRRASNRLGTYNSVLGGDVPENLDSGAQTHLQMRQFDLNQNPITLKCRLYIIKALLFRSWDGSGKADPYIKVVVDNTVIFNDIKSKILNTLEPVFGKTYEFEVKIPKNSMIHIQVWDWDLASVDDMIAETSIDLENRWFSCHRGTCGLAKRYDSTGYNAWRDTKRPVAILEELCRTSNIDLPAYTVDFRSVSIGDVHFDCDPECIEFTKNTTENEMAHRKVHHEKTGEYIKQNTALVALHGWGRKINPKGALVNEHIECRTLIDPKYPDIEQGKLEMWLDFFPMSRPPSSAPLDITPPEPKPYQLRLTILNTYDVELSDENILTGEKTSDIYVKAWIIGENIDAQQTDIHYRSLTGEGNFNWRFIFTFNYVAVERKIIHDKESLFQIGAMRNKIPPRIIIRVYDADLLSADDFLGECILNLAHFAVGAQSARKCKADIVLNPKQPKINLFQKKRAAGFWPMIAPLKVGEIRDKDLLGGTFEAEFALLTAEEAEQNPAGKAREAPQPLDEPNRPKNSFLWFTSPWKTFRYVIWKNFKWPIIIGLILFVFIVFFLLAIWTLPGEVIRQVADKIFKTNN